MGQVWAENDNLEFLGVGGLFLVDNPEDGPGVTALIPNSGSCWEKISVHPCVRIINNPNVNITTKYNIKPLGNFCDILDKFLAS